ncbi:unnamed protein product, partial [Iphiclides podalirius]
MPQTISMVQQIHPLGGMAQPLVGQINANQAAQNASITQALVGSGLVQTSVGMQQALNHTTPLQTVSANSLTSPQLTLQAPGTVGLIAAPVQGSVLPLQPQTTIVAHVKNEEDKSQIATQWKVIPQRSFEPLYSLTSKAPVVQPITPQALVQAETTSEAVASVSSGYTASSTVATIASSLTTTAAPATNDSTISTSTSLIGAVGSNEAKSSPQKPESQNSNEATSTSVAAVASVATSTPPVPSSAQQTTPVAPQVVTTVASSSSVATTTAATVPPSVGTAPLFKSSQCPPRHISQQTVHDKGLPKAMVKPNILTHVIEGYVIQEAAEPFAVNRPVREWAADKDQDKENKLPSPDEPPRKKQMLDHGGSQSRISSSVVDPGEAAAHSAKADAAGDCAPDDSAQPKIPNANKWSVAEVCDFIRNIPGCAGYADEFLMQEVDGEALLLIRPEHLVMALSMKLGPALKIVACIDSLRPESEQPANDHD